MNKPRRTALAAFDSYRVSARTLLRTVRRQVEIMYNCVPVFSLIHFLTDRISSVKCVPTGRRHISDFPSERAQQPLSPLDPSPFSERRRRHSRPTCLHENECAFSRTDSRPIRGACSIVGLL